LAAILYGTTGGISVLFAMIVTPQFRGVTRISIYISFISLLSLFIWIRDINLLKKMRLFTAFFASIFVALFIISFVMYDQIPVGARKSSVKNENIFIYKKFIELIEGEISKGGMIYTLPYLEYPEAAPLYKEGYNAMMRTYFFSQHAKWSYGAVKGRIGDAWLKELETLPIEKRLFALRKTGFEGVYIDRLAYKDHGKQIEDELIKLADGKPFVSEDENYAFYPLKSYAIRDINPVTAHHPKKGFYQVEFLGSDFWYWSSGKGIYEIYNFSNIEKKVNFKGALGTIRNQNIKFKIKNELIYTFSLDISKNIDFKIPIMLKPGLNIIHMSVDSDPVVITNDPRKLGFKLITPSVEFI